LAALSCSSSHVEGSTETGNPPVIDVDRIALATDADSQVVHVIGKAGAVTPGATVSIEVLGTDQQIEVEASASGAFDVALENASPSAIVEVRAGSKDNRSAPIYVSASGTVEGESDGGKLSCMQRSNIASQLVGSAIESANQCAADADCHYVPAATVCTAPCGDVLTGRSAASMIANTVDWIDGNLCRDFMSDGCKLIIPPCIPMIPADLKCVNSRCEEVPRQ
jgi:hypothetical protein